jgi:hypothetical protein
MSWLNCSHASGFKLRAGKSSVQDEKTESPYSLEVELSTACIIDSSLFRCNIQGCGAKGPLLIDLS